MLEIRIVYISFLGILKRIRRFIYDDNFNIYIDIVASQIIQTA